MDDLVTKYKENEKLVLGMNSFSLALHLGMVMVGLAYNCEEDCKLEVSKDTCRTLPPAAKNLVYQVKK